MQILANCLVDDILYCLSQWCYIRLRSEDAEWLHTRADV
jgi:hypothetical protein